MSRSVLAFGVLFFVSFTIAQTKPANLRKPQSPSAEATSPADVLPVKRVVLYKNGVGYFEHTARVHGTQDLSIDFTSSQLNDVLKSLTAVDLGDGRISSVRYNSIAPLDERLKSLRLPFGEQVTRAGFLQAMRGARVEVHSGASSAVGRLLSVESSRRQDAKGNFVDVTDFSVMTDGGEMKNFELNPATSVRIAERDLNDEVGRYLSLIGSSRARDVRRMALTASGSGDRDVFVSYISDAEAEGKSAGDFFEYNVKQKISIARNQSALVPILQNHIEAEKVTLWNENSPPLRAVWIKNTSGQVLDAGSFNVLEADAFAGEGVLENIHPDERRLVSYAADAAVHVKFEDEASDNPYTRIKIAKGVMYLVQEQRAKKKYTIRDADTEARQVIVEFPAQEGWEMTKGTPKPEESSASFHRFRVPVEAGKSAELTVESFHPLETTYELTNLDSDEVALLVQQKRLTPVMQQSFNRILAQKDKIGGIDQQINQRKQESDQITADQNRIRENMKALKGSSEERSLLQRYTKQLDSQEIRIATLRGETDGLRKQRDTAQAELGLMIMDVNVDESF